MRASLFAWLFASSAGLAQGLPAAGFDQAPPEEVVRPDGEVRLFTPAALAARGLFAAADAQPSSDAASARGEGRAASSWGSQKSYAIPALEIVAFQSLLNLYDRAYFGCCDFDVTPSSIRRNLRGPWVVDSDTFTINQLGHPYQGAIYHGLARSAGLDFWEGLGYTFAGSVVWEIAGETTPPSRNDQIATGIGGSFLGEALFRMAHLWLEQGHGPPIWREFAAAAISPPVGFNRLAFPSRFRDVYPSRDPDYYSRLLVGFASAAHNRPGTSTGVEQNEAIVEFALDYGLPGKRGYRYERPFDYFSFKAAASSAIGIESVLTHGLLVGREAALGDDYRGVWGAFGSYDYLAPQVFRMASTAVSLGAVGEWRAAPSLALRGTALAGVGYATVSTINGVADERANHYGVAPQAAATLRFIFGERASLDLAAREYFVSRVSGGSRGGRDNVVRADATFMWRVHREHGVAVKYQVSRRDATFPDLGERVQTRGIVGLFYTYLGRDRFAIGD